MNAQKQIIINLLTIQTHVLYNISMKARFDLRYSYWCIGSIYLFVSLHSNADFTLHAPKWMISFPPQELVVAIE